MAMNKARRTANLNNILTSDTEGNYTLIANLTVDGLYVYKSTAWETITSI